MRSTIADYQLLGPAGPGTPSPGAAGRWLARPPARLVHQGDLVVTELPDPGDEGWAGVADRLRRLASVRSPHLVRLVEAGREDDDADGPCTWVASESAGLQPVPDGDRIAAIRATAAAARGVHALHQAGVAHGAVSAGSILSPEGEGGDIVVASPLDLGAPGRHDGAAVDRAALDATDPVTLWADGPSRAGDVWSLGAAVHGLVTGRRLHPGIDEDSPVTAVQRVLFEAPQVALAADDPVGRLIRSCLSPDPADRPPTASGLADDLDVLAARS